MRSATGVTEVFAMVRFQGEVHFDRPREEVFDVVADERSRYDPRIREAELLTPGPLGVGSRFRSVSASMGRPVEMTVEITAYERPRRLATTTSLAGMRIRSLLELEPQGHGTRMRWQSDVAPRGALRLLAPVIALTGRRQMRRIWAALGDRLEHEARADRTHATSGRAVNRV